MTTRDIHDPKGLMREAFAIEGITAPECRSIFLDWALSLPSGHDPLPDVQNLLARYGKVAPDDHPMVQTLQAALHAAPQARRRGGRQGRLPQT